MPTTRATVVESMLMLCRIMYMLVERALLHRRWCVPRLALMLRSFTPRRLACSVEALRRRCCVTHGGAKAGGGFVGVRAREHNSSFFSRHTPARHMRTLHMPHASHVTRRDVALRKLGVLYVHTMPRC